MAWRTSNTKDIARERIDILMLLAKDFVAKDPVLSRRYTQIARAIGMKAGVRLPKKEKMFICKGCGAILIPGNNCRVRIRSKPGTNVLVTCLGCGMKKRYPTVRERLSRKSGC